MRWGGSSLSPPLVSGRPARDNSIVMRDAISNRTDHSTAVGSHCVRDDRNLHRDGGLAFYGAFRAVAPGAIVRAKRKPHFAIRVCVCDMLTGVR
jgi:hypothetical protein